MSSWYDARDPRGDRCARVVHTRALATALRGAGPTDPGLPREYKQSGAYLAKVAERSRPDYQRTISLVIDLVRKKDDRVGDRKIRAITPLSADRIYQLILDGKENVHRSASADGQEGPKRDRRFGPKGRRGGGVPASTPTRRWLWLRLRTYNLEFMNSTSPGAPLT